MESLNKETGVNGLEVNVLSWWREQCEESAAYRAPVPSSMWRTDPERLGESDAFGNVVEVRDFAPLVSYGSLRQLRDEAGGAAYRSWPEDASTTLLRPQIEKAVEEHAEDADDATSRASSYITPSHRYGRRMAEGLVPMGEFGDHYRGNESTLSTTPPPRPGHRGRKLFLGNLLFQFIGGQISKALGKGYKSIDQELNFDVPDMPRPHFFWDHVERQTNYANDLLRDTFCNPDVALTIEQAVGDPPPHATGDDLWDAETVNRPYSLQTPASLRGGDVDRGYTANGPDGSTPTYKDTSTQSWVYVTSSDDPLVSFLPRTHPAVPASSSSDHPPPHSHFFGPTPGLAFPPERMTHTYACAARRSPPVSTDSPTCASSLTRRATRSRASRAARSHKAARGPARSGPRCNGSAPRWPTASFAAAGWRPPHTA
jgi:hypothetical protein